MLRKFLFVGLGGSGGKTLRFLRDELSGWLRDIGWSGAFPTGWQMIHIDTPTAQDGNEVRDVNMLPGANYLGLVTGGVDFRTVSDKVAAASPEDGWRELASWRVDPTFLRVPITTGAGQFRAVGRTIGLAYADRLLDALTIASSRLASAPAAAELTEIHRLAYGDLKPTVGDPVVVVVSSLAGGTGAGLLLDTCDLLRQLPGGVGHNSFGVLYASDVFSQLGGMATGGVQPNTLAALSELMNGYWLTENYQRASSLFAAAGAAKPIGQSGPAFPFLVGASNTKGITFGDQREVYAMMGRALRGWTTDPIIQDRLVAYTIANWQGSAAGNVVKADIVVRDHLPVFEAFGYGEVTLGTDRFSRYSEERLARVAAKWLLDGHQTRALENDPNDSRQPAEIADDLARDELVYFLGQVGLHERGANDQVIDALRPLETDQLLTEMQQHIEAMIFPGVKTLPASAWVERITSALPGHCDDFMRAYDERLRVRADEWVKGVPARVLAETEAVICRHGLQTAAALLRMVADEVSEVSQELVEEASSYLGWSADHRSAVASALTQSGGIPPTNTSVGDAIYQGIATGAGYQGESKRREIAQRLLVELRTGFLLPLAKAVDNARLDLDQRGLVGDGVHEPAILAWPERAVPTRLRPPRNEFLVVDLDEFPDRFDTLLGRSAQGDLARDQVDNARAAVIVGDFLAGDDGGDDVPRGLEVAAAWRPDPSLLLGGVQPRSTASFTTRFSPDALLARARAWIRRPGSAFARFIEQDLRGYLDDDPAADPREMNQRRSSFRQALASALDAAEPLVRMDAGLLALLHHRAEIPRRAVPSVLPFADHPVEEAVLELLAGALPEGSDVRSYLTTTRKIKSVSISSTLGAAHDPLVFSSIMDPIVKGWNAAKQAAPARTNFWSSRRARCIEEFVPVSHEVMAAMTRGWFTGLLLGRIDRDARTIVRGGSAVAFPQPLLRDAAHPRDLLPAILESLGLAYAEVAQLRSLEPLDPYLELRDLGLQPGLMSVEAAHLYDHVNAVLEEWVRTGATGPRIADPVVDLAAGRDLAAATPTERRDAAVKVLAQNAAEYAGRMDEYRQGWSADPAILGADRALWPGMWSMIDEALGDLETALRKLELVGNSTML